MRRADAGEPELAGENRSGQEKRAQILATDWVRSRICRSGGFRVATARHSTVIEIRAYTVAISGQTKNAARYKRSTHCILQYVHNAIYYTSNMQTSNAKYDCVLDSEWKNKCLLATDIEKKKKEREKSSIVLSTFELVDNPRILL